MSATVIGASFNPTRACSLPPAVVNTTGRVVVVPDGIA